MDEQELDAYARSPFGTADAAHQDAQLRRLLVLGQALWGGTAEDLRRQLLAPHPAIPSGFALSDFRESLKLSARICSIDLQNRNNAWMRSIPFFSATISVGTQELTASEARYKVVRKAIDYLEGH